MKKSIFSSILALPVFILGFSTKVSAIEVDPQKIRQVVQSSLKYIASEQVQQDSDIYLKGEWPTSIVSTALPAALGVGKPVGHDDEATAFTTGSVINALASLYKENPDMTQNPEFQKIPSLIAQAVPTFERYREGDLFNFYPPRMWKGVRVHQPADMTLIFAWKGFTNIPQDADTTSVVYGALLNSAEINHQQYRVPETALASLQNFRDIDRTSHFYNRREDRHNTGAFMTWQFDEKSPYMPRFWFASPEKGTRIPFNRNDVDCIVNLNVIRMLALNKTPQVEGRQEACAMINDMIRNEEHATCGIYYPNTFNLSYSVVQAEKAGAACVQEDRKKQIVEFILKRQSDDGGWDNEKNTWQDRVQTTVFAMTALLEFGDLKEVRIQSSLKYGAHYLLQNMKRSKQGDYYWKGETFFTATAIARSLVIWKSNSYTTALAANALLKVAKLYH
jgi:hypothetical protein